MGNKLPKEIPCGLCERSFEEAALTEHHLLPRSEGGTQEHVALLCRQCHSTVHATFHNKTLAVLYSKIEALRSASELQAYLKWVRRQDPTSRFRTRKKNDRT
jgi:5-methylcytosine-specific restriction enzyme A